MGSLTRSTPSIPRYVPVVPSSTGQNVDAAGSDSSEQSVKNGGNDNDENQDSVRRIIRRNRGVGSTILTSFRGVLDEKSSIKPQRKNLLGE